MKQKKYIAIIIILMAYVIEPGVSRRKVLVPAITDVLNAYPHE